MLMKLKNRNIISIAADQELTAAGLDVSCYLVRSYTRFSGLGL